MQTIMRRNGKKHKEQKAFLRLPFLKSIQPIVFLFLQATTASVSQAQSITDTIYYDNYWRICEKPVATYYRLGELKLEPQWHFANDVKDFYAKGQPEMTGHYSIDGRKNGVFTFYHPNGKPKKSGAFVNDTMNGIWSYYDTTGKLYFQANCENSLPFSPLFIKNPGGDTLLKNGAGRFALKLLDYPDVFPEAPDYMVKGQCRQGRRIGEWVYDAFYNNNWHPAGIEIYEAGRFKSGVAFSNVAGENQLQHPASVGDLSISKLTQTEAFAHDIVFGETNLNAHAPSLLNFLLHGDVPAFASEAKRFEANVLAYLPLCIAAINYGHLNEPRLFWHEGDVRSAKPNQDVWMLGYCVQTDDPKITQQSDLFPVEKLTAYTAQISFTVEQGYTSSVSVKGNFEKDIMLHMAYYLSRLTNLAPQREAGKAVSTRQNLYLFTKSNTATYHKHSYIVYRLLLSLKPQELTEDKFSIADFANAKFEDNDQ